MVTPLRIMNGKGNRSGHSLSGTVHCKHIREVTTNYQLMGADISWTSYHTPHMHSVDPAADQIQETGMQTLNRFAQMTGIRDGC